MRFLQKIIIIYSLPLYFFAALHTCHSHNIHYKGIIKNGGEIQTSNTPYNIEKAKLLQKYIDNLHKEISGYIISHEINNEFLKTQAFELRIMSTSLSKIQVYSIEKHHAESILQSSIESLKVLRVKIVSVLRSELKKSKYELTILHNEKSKKALKISQKINLFTSHFKIKTKTIKNTQQQKSILLSLSIIEKESQKLTLFHSRIFHSKKQLRDTYSNSIRSITRELHTIRALIQ